MGANKSTLVSIPKSDFESLEATLETLENRCVDHFKESRRIYEKEKQEMLENY